MSNIITLGIGGSPGSIEPFLLFGLSSLTFDVPAARTFAVAHRGGSFSAVKSPDAVLDYKIDWAALANGSGSSDWLQSGETISSYTATADSGMTINSDSKSDSDTSIVLWLSGGVVSRSYPVVCQIVTSAGRTDERTLLARCRER